MYPNAGVPPAEVLAVLSPELSLEKRQYLTEEEYGQIKTDLAQAVQDREDALSSSKFIFNMTMTFIKGHLAMFANLGKRRRRRRSADQNWNLLRRRRKHDLS